MKRALLVVFAMVSAGAAAGLADPAQAQGGSCLSDRQIYAAVEQGQLLPLEDALRQNGVDRSTQVLSVEVCDDGGGYAYHVQVINASGEARTLVLPASQ
jgi:hypothetical protein